MSSVVAIIPARSGSKSIKDKNIQFINNKPLIYWTIKSAKESKKIDQIYFSTNSIRYAEVAEKHGIKNILIRPEKICKDNSSDYQMILHAIKNIKILNYNYIVHLRPTSPIREKGDIDKAIDLIKKKNVNSLRSVHLMSESSYKTFEVSKNKRLKSLKFLNYSLNKLNESRHKFPKTYCANGVVDIYRKDFVTKNKKLHGNNVYAFLTKYSHEIDSLDDLKIARILMK